MGVIINFKVCEMKRLILIKVKITKSLECKRVQW